MKLEAIKELAVKVEAVEDAYSRWLVICHFGSIKQIEKASNSLRVSLADVFDNGPEPDGQPCGLVSLLSALIAQEEGK